MEDRSDNETTQCEEGLHNKPYMRKEQPAWKVTDSSSSDEEEPTSQFSISAPSEQMQCGDDDSAPESDSYKEEQCEGVHVDLSLRHKTAQVKEEEEASSTGDDDTHSLEENKSGDLVNAETIIQDSSLIQVEQGHNMPKVSVGRSKEISEDLRRTVVEAHKNGKGYKSISKQLGLHQSTVRQIIYKWKKFSSVVTLPRSGRPTKINAVAHRTVLKQMPKNPRVTAKNLQASLMLDNICVHESTIRKTSSDDDTCSLEEDKSSGDLVNIEAFIIQNSPLTQDEQGHDTPKFSVGRSKEISEDLRRKVVEAHKNGKGYKSISKELGLHQSTVRQIIYKWKKFSTVATLPRSGRPTKISAVARRTILKQMTKNPRVTAKDLQASLALDNICVHESTIRKTLNKWCSWDFTMEEIADLQKD